MAIQAHPQCRARLEQKLTAALSSVLVHLKNYLGQAAFEALENLDKVLPKGIQDEVAGYITETPVADFVYQSLYGELQNAFDPDLSEETEPLIQLPGYEDPNGVAKGLVREFLELPNEYVLTIPLPNRVSTFFAGEQKGYRLSSSMRIVKVDDAFEAEHPLETGNPRLDRAIGLGESSGKLADAIRGFFPAKWKRTTAYLQVDVRGFIGINGTTNTSQAAVDKLKQFLGLGIALSLFKFRRSYARGHAKAEFYVHRRIDGKLVPQRGVDLAARV